MCNGDYEQIAEEYKCLIKELFILTLERSERKSGIITDLSIRVEKYKQKEDMENMARVIKDG